MNASIPTYIIGLSIYSINVVIVFNHYIIMVKAQSYNGVAYVFMIRHPTCYGVTQLSCCHAVWIDHFIFLSYSNEPSTNLACLFFRNIVLFTFKNFKASQKREMIVMMILILC